MRRTLKVHLHPFDFRSDRFLRSCSPCALHLLPPCAALVVLESAQHGIARPVHENPSAIHDYESVHDAQHAETVRNENERLVFDHGGKTLLNDAFGFHVHVAGRLIQNKHVGIAHQRPGKPHGLPLPSGQVAPLFAHLSSEPGRMLSYEIRHA
mgnify:CR=1 FL=1